jgi:HD-like signal output (HDOD) protein
MLTRPPHDLSAWIACFRKADIPVLPRTIEELAMLRQAEEQRGCVDAKMISQGIGNDPLMALRVLMEAARRRPESVVTDAETVTAAVVMMGIDPFFRAFAELESVATRLEGQVQAMLGLQRVLKRAWRAASFALGFAVHRMDEDAAVVQTAALLHDFAEMLLWCHAPEMALRVQALQRAAPALRSAAAQREVLGIELQDLEQALMKAWRLPGLLIRMTDDKTALHPQSRTVMLAVRVARHTQDGWDTPGAQAALPDDLADLGALLSLSPEATLRLLRDIDS